MAVAWVSTGTLLGSTGADITPVIPTHTTDDILLLQAASRVTTETCATPSGWTLIDSVIGTNWRSYVFYIRAAVAGTTNPLCDWSAATGQKYGVVHVVRGALTSASPFAVAFISTDTADPSVVAPITTTVTNQYVALIGLVADNAATAVTVTNPTDPVTWTQRSYTTIATGNDAGQFFADGVKSVAGTTGNLTADFNGAPLSWAALRMAWIEEPPPSTRVPYTNPMPQLLAH